MRRINTFFITVITFSMISCTPVKQHEFLKAQITGASTYQTQNADIEKRIDDLLSKMSLEEKIDMISGEKTQFDTRPNERLGIPALHMADGPVGIRSRREASTAFPASVCMAVTWNPDLIYKAGQALGQEAKAKGKNVLLGPCVNIHRVPQGGRNFESFGEDPYLTGKIAASYIKGIQSEKVIATVKHFACNNQEFERHSIDVRVDERTLNEVYLPAFKAAVQEGGVWAVMSAYNRLNGQYCSANTNLLTDILKKQWGFQGFVMSDWGAVHSCIPELYAGLDLEMPTTAYFKINDVNEAVRRRLITPASIDDKVRRMLRAMFYMGYFDKKNDSGSDCNTPEHRAIALQVAQEGIVLLKNQNNVLPVGSNIKSIAVIGINGTKLAWGGGGSSRVTPCHTVSPLDALKAKAGKDYTVKFEPGTFFEDDFSLIPIENLVSPAGQDKKQGLLLSYYAKPNLEGNPIRQEVEVNSVDFSWHREGPQAPEPDFSSIAWTGQLVAPETGMYAIGLGSDGGASLYIDGKQVIDSRNAHGWDLKYKYATVNLEKGKPVDIKIEYYQRQRRVAVRLIWQKIEKYPSQKAVELAQSSDMAILFLGSGLSDDSEGRDRDNLSLPKEQEEMILEVTKVNPKTVIVLNGGAGIEMKKWIDNVPGLILAWFPGQEGGDAIADILLGKVNPSGKLVTTFFKNWEDCAAYNNYPGKDDVVNYTEGVFVGYRHFDAEGIEPYFAFGHGLSYTSFEYKNLVISREKIKKGESVTINVTLKNTGGRDGAEVVQLYLGDEKASVPRPVKELKGFQKVFLKAGEEKKITLKIGLQDMQFFDSCIHDWKTEPGKFNVYVGSSSRDIRLKGSFVLE
jgi:beta-glucosidase